MKPFQVCAAVVAQRDRSAARNAAQRIALWVTKAIHDGIIGIADGGAHPDVPIFVLELDVIAVAVPEDAGLALFFQMEEAARQLLPLVVA